MADSIERTIYKLELDSSGYINGVEQLSASTKKLTDNQAAANKKLQENEAALKAQAAVVEKTRKALENYTGADKKYKEQLESSFKTAKTGYAQIETYVSNVRKGYEAANKAAQDFANTSERATRLQQSTTGGKIPTGVPHGIQSNIISDINGVIDDGGDFDLKEAIAFGKTAEEFGKLKTAVAGVTPEMKGFDDIVTKGKKAVEEYEKIVGKTAGSQLSLRQELKAGQAELVKLENAGKGATKEYFELEKRVASLTDKFEKQRARIKVLSSDTRALDFGKAAITTATSAFQAYTSISILTGNESAELQKKTMQLFAAMQLLTALEQLSNAVKRGSTLATNAQSAATAVYTAVVGASTGALKAFRIALLATGIGAAVAAIGFLIFKLSQHKKALDDAGRQQKLLNEINQKAIESYAAEVVKLTAVKNKLDNLSISQKERIRFAKEYNKTADEGNKIDLKQIDNIDLVNAAIDRQIGQIRARALAQASSNITTEKATIFLKKQADFISKFPSLPTDEKDIQAYINSAEKGITDFLKGPSTGRTNRLRPTDQQKSEFLTAFLGGDIRDLINAEKEFKAAANLTNQLIVPGQLTPEKTKQALENVFEQKLKELQEKLAAVTAKSFESKGTIRKQFAASLEKELQSITELEKAGKLKGDQGGILAALLGKINQSQLDEALKGFSDKVKAARKKIFDELNDLQDKATLDGINLLQDEFEKRAALIEFNEQKEIADEKENTADRLAVFESNAELIFGKDYKTNLEYLIKKAELIRLGEQNITNIQLKAIQDRQKLSADILKDALAAVEEEASAGLGEGTGEGKPKTPPIVSKFQEYAIAIGELTQSIISFWQKANEAESAALDRSITLQEKRVEAAQRIAARGNAQYLKQEEDRLKQMQVQKENAARRDLAINAALQSSQLLVGITGAISKLAAGPLGAAQVIAEIAIIFAALATGYGLVKSLQGSQPKLAAGTKSVRRNGHPSGTDTIPAWLNEDEAVIPTHRNRAYRPSVSAIYDGSVPAEAMNNFVNNYHRVKGVPQPNYSKIKDAAEMSIGYDGKLLSEQNRLIIENNDLQRQTLRAMKNMSVSANIDRNGVAIMVNEFMIQQEIDKRV